MPGLPVIENIYGTEENIIVPDLMKQIDEEMTGTSEKEVEAVPDKTTRKASPRFRR